MAPTVESWKTTIKKRPPLQKDWQFFVQEPWSSLLCGEATAHCFGQQQEPLFSFSRPYPFEIGGLLARWHFCRGGGQISPFQTISCIWNRIWEEIEQTFLQMVYDLVLKLKIHKTKFRRIIVLIFLLYHFSRFISNFLSLCYYKNLNFVAEFIFEVSVSA